jgi:hypothetical protein
VRERVPRAHPCHHPLHLLAFPDNRFPSPAAFHPTPQHADPNLGSWLDRLKQLVGRVAFGLRSMCVDSGSGKLSVPQIIETHASARSASHRTAAPTWDGSCSGLLRCPLGGNETGDTGHASAKNL